jgi:hypothetical protein
VLAQGVQVTLLYIWSIGHSCCGHTHPSNHTSSVRVPMSTMGSPTSFYFDRCPHINPFTIHGRVKSCLAQSVPKDSHFVYKVTECPPAHLTCSPHPMEGACTLRSSLEVLHSPPLKKKFVLDNPNVLHLSRSPTMLVYNPNCHLHPHAMFCIDLSKVAPLASMLHVVVVCS